MELHEDHRTVLGTLPFRPSADDEEATYATAAAVTEVVPFGADKTRRLLAELVDAGAAELNPSGGRTKAYRRAMTEEEAWSQDDAAAQAQRDADATGDAVLDDGANDAPEAPTAPLAAPASDAVGDVMAYMSSNRPAPAEDVAAVEVKRGVCTIDGKPIHKEGRSWVHDDGDVSHKATTAVQRAPREQGERPAGAPPIYGKGVLKDKIITWLRQQPEGESFSATQVAKAVEGQNGSVQFALDAFVTKGEAKLTQEKPKRYAAA